MRKIIQKRIIKEIQPEIAEYYCDKCGAQCGTKDNPKTTWYNSGEGTEKHYCNKCKS